MKNDGLLQIRLPSAVKARLVEKAAESGGCTSVIREFIGAYLDGRITLRRDVHIGLKEEDPTA